MPLSQTENKPPYNFGGLPAEFTGYDKAKVAVVPVPFDLTTSWMSGAREGPRALIEASGYMELYDIETQTEPYRKGIFTDEEITASDSADLNRKVYERVKKHIDMDYFVVTLGGEHSVSYGAAKAHIETFSDLSILHFDAHTDRREEFEDNKFSHACTLRRISELNDDIISIGIRSLDESELQYLDPTKVLYAEEIHDSKAWIDYVIEILKPNVYLTFDLDVFDPSIMPSTGTPEPGGMYWYQMLEVLKKVTEARNLVGCDVVELSPNEQNKAPDFMAAKLIYKILAYKFALP
ncbi:MAG TPA: agmatinase [Terriglobales bacterium]|nr:agmatinase [Terriglobales bacterium]